MLGSWALTERLYIPITSTQVLRRWLATKMARLRVPGRYDSTLCVGVPESVLARHYSDYSPETLKEI